MNQQIEYLAQRRDGSVAIKFHQTRVEFDRIGIFFQLKAILGNIFHLCIAPALLFFVPRTNVHLEAKKIKVIPLLLLSTHH